MINAIIMASGLGTRMRPLTEKTPKPLIKVLGTPMVESVIDALNKANVDRIFVVVGYLKEQFAYLTGKYSNVQLIENPDYETVNNISSIFYARKILKEGSTYICEADLYVSNQNLFCTASSQACYFGKFLKGYSKDWVFDVGNDGFITRVGKCGTDLFNMVGISYFDSATAKILSDKIEKAYRREGYEALFWDDVVNENLDVLKLRVHPVNNEDIFEIDTIDELNVINNRRV